MLGLRVVGLSQVVDRLGRFGQEIDRARRQIAIKGSLIVRRMLVLRLTGQKGHHPFWGPTSPAGAHLGVRTGQTRQRLSPGGVAATYRHGDHWQAAVGSPDAHVALHEVGGTVQGNPFLTIPTAAALRRGSGTSRFAGMRPSDIPDTFVWPNRRQREGGNMKAKRLWIATAEAGELVLLYMLAESVRYRPRRIFATVRREASIQIAALGGAQVTVARTVAGV